MGKKDKRSAPATLSTSEEESTEISSPIPPKKSKKKVKVDIPIYSTEDISDLFVSEKSVFPTDLKLRHPLFGADFEDRCNLTVKYVPHEKSALHIKDEVTSNWGDSPQKQKRPIKEEPIDYEEVPEEDSCNEVAANLESTEPHKKKKRKSQV